MLTESKYRRLAFLARLDPNDKALAKARSEFNTILEYMNNIQEIDVNGLSLGDNKYFPPFSIHQRADEPNETGLSPKDMAGIAPQWEAGHFAVPGAIQSEG